MTIPHMTCQRVTPLCLLTSSIKQTLQSQCRQVETHTGWLDSCSGQHRKYTNVQKRSQGENASVRGVDMKAANQPGWATLRDIIGKFTSRQSNGTNAWDMQSVLASGLRGRVRGIYHLVQLKHKVKVVRFDALNLSPCNVFKALVGNAEGHR